jgi:putative lipoprotein
MSKHKLLNLILIAFMFNGCSNLFWNTPAPKKYKVKPQITKPKPATTGSIKGVIQDVTYQNNAYCYNIKATDISNGKLNSGVYCADKFYHENGDLVYAGIKNGKIISMLLINQSNKNLKISQKSKTNIIKTDKKRDISKKSTINIPQSQSISFD